LDVFYHPRTITLLVVGLFCLLLLAFQTESVDTVSNVKFGVIGIVFCVLLLSCVAFPNGPFTRPHPIFWRLVLGVSICYWLALVFLLFQSVDDARRIVNNSASPMQPILKEYAADCSLTWNNLYEGIFDIYFIAHFVGWMLKAIMIRDVYILWIGSILWELMELSFEHMLPNFAECWWDSFIMDISVCNALGILVGLRICRYLEMREYKWSGILEIPHFGGKMKRLALQFTPQSWTIVEWKTTSSIGSFFGVILLIFGLQLADLNGFFLKDILWIKSQDYIVTYRLCLLWLCGCPTIRQIYIYVTDPSCLRLGSQAWVVICILMTELLIVIKFGRGIFPQLVPSTNVMIGWSIGLIMLFSFCAMAIYYKNSPNRLKKD
jgi:hypothetical protein